MIKSLICISLMLGSSSLLTHCVGQVQQDRQPRPSIPDATERRNLNSQQRQQQYRLLLQRFDVNKNGRLESSEWARVREAMPALQRDREGNNPTNQSRTELSRQILQRFDKDGDGALNDAERAAARQAQFRQRQPNSRQLFSFNVKRNRLDPSRLLRKYDLDGDGRLNGDERKAAIDALPGK